MPAAPRPSAGYMMAQNTSHAVMSQRYEAHDSLDDFPTPPWAARALCQHVIGMGRHQQVVWEPAANRLFMARGLADYFGSVETSDIHVYEGQSYPQHDFLMPLSLPHDKPDWIITNPPFRLAEQFAIRALEEAAEGVAILVRTQFLESVGRYERLFRPHPPFSVAQFVERVPMVKGRCDPNASTATGYAWIIWRKDRDVLTQFEWIKPCRKQLEREGDYA